MKLVEIFVEADQPEKFEDVDDQDCLVCQL